MSSGCLIFISGWATDASCWEPVIGEIDCHISHHHVDWWKCLNNAAEKNALYQLLRKEKAGAIIVGWSLGALMALEGVAFRPEGVKALVLVSGTSRMTSSGSYPGVNLRELNAMRARLRRSPRAVIEAFGRLCIGDQQEFSIETDEFLEKFVDRAERLDVASLAEGLRYLKERDLRPILPEIQVPVHLLHGDCDRIIPVECARYMEKVIPEARLDIVHGGSHALLYTAYNRVAGLITGSIRDLMDADCRTQ